MPSVYVAAVQAGKQKANGTPSRFSARTDIKNVKTRFAIISDGRVYSWRHILTQDGAGFTNRRKLCHLFPLRSICPPLDCLLSSGYCQSSSSVEEFAPSSSSIVELEVEVPLSQLKGKRTHGHSEGNSWPCHARLFQPLLTFHSWKIVPKRYWSIFLDTFSQLVSQSQVSGYSGSSQVWALRVETWTLPAPLGKRSLTSLEQSSSVAKL